MPFLLLSVEDTGFSLSFQLFPVFDAFTLLQNLYFLTIDNPYAIVYATVFQLFLPAGLGKNFITDRR
jgi:hypothetical protein